MAGGLEMRVVKIPSGAAPAYAELLEVRK